MEILADAGYQGLGAQTGGRVVTPPHRKFKKNPPQWYEETYERQRKAHSSHRIRVEHGIAHLKNSRALARHHGRREHMSETIPTVARLLSHQQTATHRPGHTPCHLADLHPSTSHGQPCTSSLAAWSSNSPRGPARPHVSGKSTTASMSGSSSVRDCASGSLPCRKVPLR